jgi:hypothetical protein
MVKVIDKVVYLFESFILRLFDLLEEKILCNFLCCQKEWVEVWLKLAKDICHRRYPSTKLLKMLDYFKYLQRRESTIRKCDDYILKIGNELASVDLVYEFETESYQGSLEVQNAQKEAFKKEWYGRNVVMVLLDANTKEELCRREPVADEADNKNRIIFASGTANLVLADSMFVVEMMEQKNEFIGEFLMIHPERGGPKLIKYTRIPCNAMNKCFYDPQAIVQANAYAIAVDIWGFRENGKKEIFSGILSCDEDESGFVSTSNECVNFGRSESIDLDEIHCSVCLIRIDGAVYFLYEGKVDEDFEFQAFDLVMTCWEEGESYGLFMRMFLDKDDIVSKLEELEYEERIHIPKSCRMKLCFGGGGEHWEIGLKNFGAGLFGAMWNVECQVQVRDSFKRQWDGKPCFEGVDVVNQGMQLKFESIEDTF